MKKSILIIIVFSFIFPSNIFAQETTAKSKTNFNLYYTASALGFGIGISSWSSANRYENKYDDPFKYDQKEVEQHADNLKLLAVVGVATGVVFLVLGLNESVKKTTQKVQISVEPKDTGQFLVFNYRF